MEYQWNTGRSYTVRGQVICAIVLDDNSILFADLSRGIDGHIPADPRPIRTHDVLRARVMVAYDQNKYQGDVHSMTYANQCRGR